MKILHPINTQAISHFLSDQREIEAVLSYGQTPSVEPVSSIHCLEKIGNLTTYFFLYVAGYLFRSVGFQSLSKRAFVTSAHAYADYREPMIRRLFEKHLLAISKNVHRKDSADFYLRPEVATPSLPCFYPKPTVMQTFHREGICRGMCLWFVHLYFSTRESFNSRELQMRAIGKQFEQGANAQSALIQAMNTDSTRPLFNFLPLRSEAIREDIRSELLLESLWSLPEGIYGIYTSDHAMLWIQQGEAGQYFFDPSQGTISVSSRAILDSALRQPLSRHKIQDKILIDRYSIF